MGEPLKDKGYGLTNIESWKVDLIERAEEDTINLTRWFKDRNIKSAVEWLKDKVNHPTPKDDGDFVQYINRMIDQAFPDLVKTKKGE